MVSIGLTPFCFWVKWRVWSVKRNALHVLPPPTGTGRKGDSRILQRSRGFKKLNRHFQQLSSRSYHKSITKLLLWAMSPLVAGCGCLFRSVTKAHFSPREGFYCKFQDRFAVRRSEPSLLMENRLVHFIFPFFLPLALAV